MCQFDNISYLIENVNNYLCIKFVYPNELNFQIYSKTCKQNYKANHICYENNFQQTKKNLNANKLSTKQRTLSLIRFIVEIFIQSRNKYQTF